MLIIIVGINEKNGIGVNGKIPWYEPIDLLWFRNMTAKHTIIMGRKTFESIGKPLPNRRNIVVTSTKIEGVECVKSLDEALEITHGIKFVIGGSLLYEEALDKATFAYVTKIPNSSDCDAFFPYEKLLKNYNLITKFDIGGLMVESFKNKSLC